VRGANRLHYHYANGP